MVSNIIPGNKGNKSIQQPSTTNLLLTTNTNKTTRRDQDSSFFPVYTWKPQSELETLAQRLAPSDRLLSMAKSHGSLDAASRILMVTQWFLSQYLSSIPNSDSWTSSSSIHPLLGEIFKCSWRHSTRSRYLGKESTTEFTAEQVTPSSCAVHWENSVYGVCLDATLSNESDSYRYGMGTIDCQQTIVDDYINEAPGLFSSSSPRFSLSVVSPASFVYSPFATLSPSSSTAATSSHTPSPSSSSLSPSRCSFSQGSSLVLRMKDLGETYRIRLPVVRHKFSLWGTGNQSVQLAKELCITCSQTGMSSVVNFQAPSPLPRSKTQDKKNKETVDSTVAEQDNCTNKAPFKGKIEHWEKSSKTSSVKKVLVAELSGDLSQNLKVVSRSNLLPFDEQEWDMNESSDDELPCQELLVKPLSEQMENESQRLWYPLIYALTKRKDKEDYVVAERQEEKSILDLWEQTRKEFNESRDASSVELPLYFGTDHLTSDGQPIFVYKKLGQALSGTICASPSSRV